MESHRIETTLEQDGTVTLRGLPFHAGDTVEVTIVPKATLPKQNGYPLRGTPVTYKDPFEPVAAEDWESAKVIVLDTHVWVWFGPDYCGNRTNTRLRVANFGSQDSHLRARKDRSLRICQ